MPSFSAERAAHLEFTRAKIERRLDGKTDRKDFTAYVSFPLSPLWYFTNTAHKILRHNDERGMTRQEIISTSRVLLSAGSETTATLLCGATYYLTQNPEVLSRLQSEVREAFRTAEDITLRSVSTPGLLPYLESVLLESLRCYPPVPAILPRITGPEGALIDGSLVPANVLGVLPARTFNTLTNVSRSRWAFTNGPRIVVAIISHCLTNSPLSAGFLTPLPSTMTMTRPRCSLFRWVLEGVSGRGECLSRQSRPWPNDEINGIRGHSNITRV